MVKEGSDKKIMLDLVNSCRKGTNPGIDQFGSFTSAFQYKRLYELFRKFVKPGAKVLDWGSGHGHFSYWLVKSGFSTYGYGFEGFSFKNLVGQDYNYKQGSFDSPKLIPYQTNLFDAVTSIGVLEHVKDTGGEELSSLKEISRILKPKGFFVCYHLPNKYSWIEFLANFIPNKHHHNNRYTEKDIKSLVKESGMELIVVNKYGFLPRNSWGKLGERVAFSTTVNYIWEIIDRIFSFVFKPICQNYYFVAKKNENWN